MINCEHLVIASARQGTACFSRQIGAREVVASTKTRGSDAAGIFVAGQECAAALVSSLRVSHAAHLMAPLPVAGARPGNASLVHLLLGTVDLCDTSRAVDACAAQSLLG